MRNRLFAQNAIEVLILRQALVVPTGRQGIRVIAEAIEEPRIAEVRQVVRRQIEVAILVVVAIEESRQIERSRERKKSRKDVRMAQRDVHRVVPSEAAPECKQAWIVVFLAN